MVAEPVVGQAKAWSIVGNRGRDKGPRGRRQEDEDARRHRDTLRDLGNVGTEADGTQKVM